METAVPATFHNLASLFKISLPQGIDLLSVPSEDESPRPNMGHAAPMHSAQMTGNGHDVTVGDNDVASIRKPSGENRAKVTSRNRRRSASSETSIDCVALDSRSTSRVMKSTLRYLSNARDDVSIDQAPNERESSGRTVPQKMGRLSAEQSSVDIRESLLFPSDSALLKYLIYMESRSNHATTESFSEANRQLSKSQHSTTMLQEMEDYADRSEAICDTKCELSTRQAPQFSTGLSSKEADLFCFNVSNLRGQKSKIIDDLFLSTLPFRSHLRKLISMVWRSICNLFLIVLSNHRAAYLNPFCFSKKLCQKHYMSLAT